MYTKTRVRSEACAQPSEVLGLVRVLSWNPLEAGWPLQAHLEDALVKLKRSRHWLLNLGAVTGSQLVYHS